jgi:Phage portal protein
VSWIRSVVSRPTGIRAEGTYTLDDLVSWMRAAGTPLINQTWATNEEVIEGNFAGLVGGAFEANSVVFACLAKRFQLFSQARFQFQQLRGGQPGDLFGTPDLRILEQPEPGETTADLLTVARLDADLAGDWFGVRRAGPRIKRLRPDWTTILIGSPNPAVQFPAWDPDAEIAGYSYSPFSVGGAYSSSSDVWTFDRTEVAHFAPIRDPLAKYRGIPLPTAALREIRGDSAATTHKLMFFEHAATPNMVVKFPSTMDVDKARAWVDKFEEEHHGALNAYRTMYLLGGMEAAVVGKDMQQLDFAATQGKGETRIVAALGLHPAVVPVSEGMQGSALNPNTLGAARRLVADTFLRPDWGSFAGSLETIVPPLPGSRLWYDERHVPFLAEDVKDAVDALFVQAQAMRQLGDGGWDHDAVVDAVTSGDLRRLSGQHTGLVPVQLQAPGAQMPNGQAPGAMAARRDFWPVSGDWVDARITRGDLFAPDHPLVGRFPSLFQPVAAEPARPVHAWIVTPPLPALPAPSDGGQ